MMSRSYQTQGGGHSRQGYSMSKGEEQQGVWGAGQKEGL